MARQTIPVVDRRQFADGDAADQARFVQALGEALVEYGFVAVDHHSVPAETVSAGFAALRELFALPEEAKRQYEDSSTGRQRGYTSFGKEKAKDRSVADLKEFWHVGPPLPPDHPAARRMPPNVWPAEVPGFEAATLALWRAMHRCGDLLMRALARYLGAEEHEFVHMTDGGNTILRLIRYPGPEEVDAEPEAVWAAEHEDINLITLLPEATEPGLELLRRDGRWLPIAPIPGQVIADAGDMLERLTNGHIAATTHRVLAPRDHSGPRYSMPFFMHPHLDHVLSPVPDCVTADTPRRWADITAGDYLHERLVQIGLAEGP